MVPVPTFWQVTVPVLHNKKWRFLRIRFHNTKRRGRKNLPKAGQLAENGLLPGLQWSQNSRRQLFRTPTQALAATNRTKEVGTIRTRYRTYLKSNENLFLHLVPCINCARSTGTVPFYRKPHCWALTRSRIFSQNLFTKKPKKRFQQEFT